MHESPGARRAAVRARPGVIAISMPEPVLSSISTGNFPKTAHLLKHADFQRVYKKGARCFSSEMTVFYLRRESSESSVVGCRFGFTTPKAIGKAVVRNRIRRRLRELVRRHREVLEALPTPVDVVIHPRRSAAEALFDKLERELSRAFLQIQRAQQGRRRTTEPSE